MRRACMCVSSGCHNKIPRTGALTNRSLFSYSFAGWKSKVKAMAGLVSSEAPLHAGLLLLPSTSDSRDQDGSQEEVKAEAHHCDLASEASNVVPCAAFSWPHRSALIQQARGPREGVGTKKRDSLMILATTMLRGITCSVPAMSLASGRNNLI